MLQVLYRVLSVGVDTTLHFPAPLAEALETLVREQGNGLTLRVEQAYVRPSWRSAAEFREKLALVEALWGGQAWRIVQARKDHEDLFGDAILDGEDHYVYTTGPGWGDKLRLSRASMDALITLLIDCHPGLAAVAQDMRAQQEQQMREERREITAAISRSLGGSGLFEGPKGEGS